MKMTHLLLSAFVALPLSASAQTATDAAPTATPASSPETSVDTYKAENEAVNREEGMDRSASRFQKDVTELKSDIQNAAGSASAEMRSRFEALTQRVDSLENRIRDSWKSSKKTLKDEYKELRKEFKTAKKEAGKSSSSYGNENRAPDTTAPGTRHTSDDMSKPDSDMAVPPTGSDSSGQRLPPAAPVTP